jgi:hypothetical protein
MVRLLREHQHVGSLVELGPHPRYCILEWFGPNGDFNAWREALEEMLFELEDKVAN